MAVEKRDYTDPNLKNLSTEVTVPVEKTRQEEIEDAAQILINEEELLIDDEIEEVEPEPDFNANLVDFVSDDALESLSSDLLQSIESDKQSRGDWEKTYVDGLKYLGMKFDEQRSEPFEGSSGVIHPILAEAVTQFQAQSYKEMLPAQGPVKTQIIGQRTAEVESQADRVKEFMNFYIMILNWISFCFIYHLQDLLLRKFILILF